MEVVTQDELYWFSDILRILEEAIHVYDVMEYRGMKIERLVRAHENAQHAPNT